MKIRQIQRIRILDVIGKSATGHLKKFINMFMPQWRIKFEDVPGFNCFVDSSMKCH